MNEVKLSVIVPVYNAEQYLRRCVDSILDATIFLGGDCPKTKLGSHP